MPANFFDPHSYTRRWPLASAPQALVGATGRSPLRLASWCIPIRPASISSPLGHTDGAGLIGCRVWGKALGWNAEEKKALTGARRSCARPGWAPGHRAPVVLGPAIGKQAGDAACQRLHGD